jgi:hypothetical protein
LAWSHLSSGFFSLKISRTLFRIWLGIFSLS